MDETIIVSVVSSMGQGNAHVDKGSIGGIEVGVYKRGELGRYSFDTHGKINERYILHFLKGYGFRVLQNVVRWEKVMLYDWEGLSVYCIGSFS